jgi:hypothetical protein
MRPQQTISILFLLLAMLFISTGDQFLPSPLNDYSRNTRNGINDFLSGLFPNKEFKNPNQPVEDLIKKI